jgi:hypothetical protein
MKTTAHFFPLLVCVAAVGSSALLFATPLFAQADPSSNYYSAYFEPPYFNAGAGGETLIGQSGYALSGGTSSQWTVTNGVGVNGSAGVVASGTPDTATAGAAGTSAYITFTYPAVGAKPSAGMLLVSSISIQASAPTMADSLLYASGVYSNNGAEIGRVGLAYSAGKIDAVVLTCLNSQTGQPDPSGPVQALTVATNLTAGTFYNFGMTFNFATDTYNVAMNGTTVASDLPFSDTNPIADKSVQAEYLQIISGGNANEADTTGVFDNLSVDFETPVPEPSGWEMVLATLGVLGLVRCRCLPRA